MKLFDIFKKKPKRTRFRDRESVFFTMTDENGISYANMSDTIEYIPVGSVLRSFPKRKCDKPIDDDTAVKNIMNCLRNFREDMMGAIERSKHE